jgi:hypothetical protein
MNVRPYVIALIVGCRAAAPGPADQTPERKVSFPPGFKMEVLSQGQHDAADREVHLAAAVHESGCRVDIFFDSSTPLTNDQIPEFGRQLIATSARNLPHMRLGTPGLVTEEGVNLFFVTYMLRDGSEKGTMLIRSFSGSPLRAMVHGPRTPASTPVLMAAREHMMQSLVSAAH